METWGFFFNFFWNYGYYYFLKHVILALFISLFGYIYLSCKRRSGWGWQYPIGQAAPKWMDVKWFFCWIPVTNLTMVVSSVAVFLLPILPTNRPTKSR
jgi:hypothetical protein